MIFGKKYNSYRLVNVYFCLAIQFQMFMEKAGYVPLSFYINYCSARFDYTHAYNGDFIGRNMMKQDGSFWQS